MIDKLQLFVSAFKYAASADTAYGEYDPDQHGPLHNHCGCVAYALQQLQADQSSQAKSMELSTTGIK